MLLYRTRSTNALWEKSKKKGQIVRCKREGSIYSSRSGQWLCNKHFDEVETSIDSYINNEITKSPKRVNTTLQDSY